VTTLVPTIQIDEDRREIRAGGRALLVQPKVFDLLVYLARNRQRVVPKSELLEAVWPGVVVTEASLQRAISLARSALTELGATETIATHARHGYRYHEPEPPREPGADGSESVLREARAAYDRGEWRAAITLLETVDDLEGVGADDLQRWAHAAQCLGRPNDALRVLERAVAAFSARGDRRRAAWAAILTAHLRMEWGENVLANGWLQRAARLLEGLPDGREQGYVQMLEARVALGQNQPARALGHALRACELGRAHADPDLEGLGRMQAGQAWLFTGNTPEGLNALDEAAVAVGASGLSAWAGGLVYCGVIYSYMTRADWQRAGQWTTEFTRWCEGKGVAAYPGLCRMHRAEVLAAKGELPEALREMDATLEMLGECAPWALGDAWLVKGEILLAQGSFEAARAAFVQAAELGWDSTFGLALVRYHEGDAAGALRQLSQCLDEEGISCRTRLGTSLAYLAMVAAAAGQLEQARAALATLAQRPDLTSTPLLGALLARARGEVLAVDGDRREAIRQLRAASRSCHAANAPLACAEVRRSLARVMIAERDFESAEVELGAAANLFRRAGASGQLATCEALSRDLRLAREAAPHHAGDA
jgi:DNA-binding winged helix-turn-helix (wHTH) protein/predicted negative regulator of RcsB-dependent stress response